MAVPSADRCIADGTVLGDGCTAYFTFTGFALLPIFCSGRGRLLLLIQLCLVALQTFQHGGAFLTRHPAPVFGRGRAGRGSGQVLSRPRSFFWLHLLTLAHRRCHRGVLLRALILLDLGCSLPFTGFSGLGRGLLPWRLLCLLWLTEVMDALEDHICSVDLRYRHDDVHHLAVTVRIPNGRE